MCSDLGCSCKAFSTRYFASNSSSSPLVRYTSQSRFKLFNRNSASPLSSINMATGCCSKMRAKSSLNQVSIIVGHP
ncbi:Uncharacterised protein [Vibrio cholerae]|nr:Uncharacterised protein [Vibrio cholerae]